MSSTFALYLAAAAAALYGVAGWRSSGPPRRIDGWLAPAALILHLIVLTGQLFAQHAVTIGLHEALSLFAWQSALLLWLFCLREPLHVLGVVLYPLAGLAALVATFLPSPIQPVPISDWKVELHVVLSLLSAGLLTLAAAQALALAVQDRLLHRHQRFELLQRLPPLQTMERLLFQLIALGFFLLSLTLISAAPFVHDLLRQHLAHKTVLSVIAWVLFAVLLWGRRYHGWRGRVAIRWALSGYALLILAYFGSKWVLEEVLHRQWT
jgi:ABC-type uncharacterized transport system permease subunit